MLINGTFEEMIYIINIRALFKINQNKKPIITTDLEDNCSLLLLLDRMSIEKEVIVISIRLFILKIYLEIIYWLALREYMDKIRYH